MQINNMILKSFYWKYKLNHGQMAKMSNIGGSKVGKDTFRRFTVDYRHPDYSVVSDFMLDCFIKGFVSEYNLTEDEITFFVHSNKRNLNEYLEIRTTK